MGHLFRFYDACMFAAKDVGALQPITARLDDVADQGRIAAAQMAYQLPVSGPFVEVKKILFRPRYQSRHTEEL
jgi:hypothetical protein